MSTSQLSAFPSLAPTGRVGEGLNISIITLDEVTSTNTFLADYHPSDPAEITLVTAEHQTAGRGQTGNSWESERSKNLLFSILLTPQSPLPATHLFLISEAMALAIRDALEQFIVNCSPLTVKWPNDIYVGDRKIAGILIENTLCGSHVGRCIIGCGVNINQATFHSDAPNPVSLRQLLGHDIERSLVLDAIVTHFHRNLSTLDTPHSLDVPPLHSAYLTALYRRTGLHPFREPSSPTPFLAEIADVEPTGHLVLRDTDHHLRRYAFKEISFVIS